MPNASGNVIILKNQCIVALHYYVEQYALEIPELLSLYFQNVYTQSHVEIQFTLTILLENLFFILL